MIPQETLQNIVSEDYLILVHEATELWILVAEFLI